MTNLKHIPLQGAYNVRDLGGYPAAGGKVTRWGVLYRSDALAELTESDWSVLKKRNVKAVIDLRSQREVASAGITPPEGIEYLHYSLMRELDRNMDSVSPQTILQRMI